MKAQEHPRQVERLAQLRHYEILDTPREEEFEEIARLAADICDVPVAVINFIDEDRQWFKAETGLGVRSTPLDTSLCSHVILEHEFVEIPDTLADSRMCDNPLCLGDEGFRFYAGALLATDDGLPLGTLCTLDRKPRRLTELQRRTLRVLANRVMSELDLRLALKREKVLRREIDHRVKNSLASIAGIVRLQASRASSGDAREALDAVGARIGALASLHEEFHQDHAAGTVDLTGLVGRAMSGLRRLIPGAIKLHTEVEAGQLPSNSASALVLMINEFVTNSAKHAFASESGDIWVTVSMGEGGLRLVCEDNGTADSGTLARLEESSGLGSRVIAALARSLDTSAQWSVRDPGLRLEVVAGYRADA